jgi:predicted glycogen debranching enzyme
VASIDRRTGEAVITIENPNPEQHLRTEWLLTNGLGGYAMGTVLGVNTRRYHGLLVAAVNPPVERIVALHSMIEQLVIPRDDGTEEVVDLSTQMFVGPPPGHEPMLHPDGSARLVNVHFSLTSEGGILWEWRVNQTHIERSLTMAHESNGITIGYFLTRNPFPCRLRLRPLVSLRSFHGLSHGAPLDVAIGIANSLSVSTPGCTLDFLLMCSGEWVSDPQIWRGFRYMEEDARGLPSVEHLWSPGHFEANLNGDRDSFAELRVSINQPDSPELDWSRSKRPLARMFSEDRYGLLRAARAFPVRRIERSHARWSILAGYPWFSDWGRDAMIALPGLLLTTGRHDDALSVLRTFAAHMKHGLIPNRFADDGGPAEYNTVDASLWFVYAVWQWWQAVNAQVNTPVPDDLLAACRDIVHAYRAGIRVQDESHSFSIGLTRAGLVHAGDENTQLTWMDAKRDGVVFTPRHGLAVEVNALWHNALRCLADMVTDPMQRDHLRELAGQVALAFQMHFWWGEMNCLHDVLAHQIAPERQPEYVADGSYRFPIKQPTHPQSLSHAEKGGLLPREWMPDGKLRPNQIIAAALPYSPLTPQQRRGVIDCVRRRFLTAFGLRTLDRADPDYRARYEGNLFERDAAYHNGTVWPWLIGPFGEAVLRVDGFSESSRLEVRALIQPLLAELQATDGPRCLGQIAEVYDGDPPHWPSGCTAQAWSVAEVMRLLAMTGG